MGAIFEAGLRLFVILCKVIFELIICYFVLETEVLAPFFRPSLILPKVIFFKAAKRNRSSAIFWFHISGLARGP